MLLMTFTAPLFLIADGIISLIPQAVFVANSGISQMLAMFSTAFQFFPLDVWIAVFASITFWVSIQILYGVINFILKLIPLVGMGQ